MSLRDDLAQSLIRLAVGARIPGRWFSHPPDSTALAARTGALEIEIVSHCWQYAHLLNYQLSSLVNFPPTRARIRMTVFHAREDERTRALLERFGGIEVPGVEWNWQPLPPTELFRRAIGRNRVARGTSADWVWFSDCDIVFHRDCLDTLADQLQGRRDLLVYPKEERVTAMLQDSDPILNTKAGHPGVVDIDPGQFTLMVNPPKAKGAYQIVHGDVARHSGYCEQLPVFQRPTARWAKTYEDTAFRWLLGTDGVGLELPGVYRIRHIHKGRYGENSTTAALRGGIRSAKAKVRKR